MKDKVVHIFPTDNEDGGEWNHDDWFYKLTFYVKGKYNRIGKLYKSRSAASKAGNKIGKVVHWYSI